MQCLYAMSCELRWHSRHNTLCQDVGSLSIGGGVGGVRNLREDGGTGKTPRSVGRATIGSATAGGATDGSDAGSTCRAGGSGGGKAGSTPGGTGVGATDGGNTGNVGGAGGSGSGEAGTTSGGTGGTDSGGIDSVVDLRGGEDWGRSLDCCVAGQDGGERRSLPSGSKSRKSSTSFRRLLVILAGSETISGRDGGDGAQLGRDASPPAGVAATGLDDWAGPLSTAVAACLHLRRRRWWRRRIPAAAAVSAGADIEQVTERTWTPAVRGL